MVQLPRHVHKHRKWCLPFASKIYTSRGVLLLLFVVFFLFTPSFSSVISTIGTLIHLASSSHLSHPEVTACVAGLALWSSGCHCSLQPLTLTHQQKEICYHRIIEWFGLEGTLKIILFLPPCHGQGHIPLDQVAQSPIQPSLEHFQGGGKLFSLAKLQAGIAEDLVSAPLF